MLLYSDTPMASNLSRDTAARSQAQINLAHPTSARPPTDYRLPWAFAVAALLVLAACTSPPSRESQAPAQSVAELSDPAQLLAAVERLQSTGAVREAAQLYVRAAQASPDEQVADTAARTCYDNHQLQAAALIAQRWLDINPTSQPARELAAMAALRLYRIDAAREHLQLLLESAYITPAAGFIELEPKLAAVDSHAATAVFKQLVERMPTIAEAHYVLAQLAGQTDDWTLMLSEARRAQQMAPFWSPAGLLLARAQLVNGQTDDALNTAQAVVKNDDSTATRSEYAGVLLASKRGAEAVKLWRELEDQGGDNSAAVRALAQLDFELGSYQSAFTRFNKLLNTGKNLSESIFYLGNIAERTGAKDEARQLYERVQEGEFAAAAQLRVARLVNESDGLNAALTFLQAYGEANPSEMLLSLKARAEMLSEAGNDAAALALYDRAVKDYPDVAELRLSRAFQLVKMHKITAALQAMRQLVDERPQDPTVLNALGYTLVDNSQQVQIGHDYIAAALSYSPDSGAVLDSMGWALFKLGKKSDALAYLERAATRLVDTDLDIHLGEVLWSLNRHDDAVKVWQAGLQRAPDNKVLQQRVKRGLRK